MAEKTLPENRRKAGKRGGQRSTSFRPGQSGNPGGRPKLPPEIVELRALARQHTPEAVKAIIAVMGDKKAPASARVTAASEILDRGWGRAPATMEHSGPGGGAIPLGLQPPDYDKLLADVRAKYGDKRKPGP